MTAHNLDLIAALLVSFAVVIPLAVWVDKRVNRKSPVVKLPDRSNVVRLQRRNGATVVRIDSKRTGGAAS